MSILNEIIEHKKKEVFETRSLVNPLTYNLVPMFKKTRVRLKKRLLEHKGPAIIAEFKRQSPSVGSINPMCDTKEIAPAYEEAGAIAMSVLTDDKYFGGEMQDLREARRACKLPLLRKDFIIEEYQLLQSKAYGADIILLIAAALSKEDCANLAKQAKALKLDVLLEIHNEAELEYLDDNIDFVGVNNRDLSTMKVDVENAIRLAPMIPKKYIKVAESGINSVDTVKKLYEAGYKLFLIGEHFMKEDEPGFAATEFINALK
jgi:indole-3-glycerol phosphate synthase